MTDRSGPAGAGGETRRRTHDRGLPLTTFIVRVGANEAGGVVEYARTGRKERFDGVEAISGVIAALVLAVSNPGCSSP